MVNILEEIGKMNGVVEDLVIDKFLKFDIKTIKCSTVKDEFIEIEYTLDKEEKSEWKVVYKIERTKLYIKIINIRKYGYSDSKFKKWEKEIPVPNYWNIFLKKRTKELKKQIIELFNFKQNEKE